jgi:TetR/AcrR family transcriptional regulator, transcriptional repressor for nem operon
MARQREFDKEKVLDQAMRLFWTQGYEATSVRDLNTAMGISSSSMYEFFGDKRAVFLEVLSRYCDFEQARIRQMAAEAPTPQAFIQRMFANLDEVVQSEAVGQGSFTVNAMVEFGTRDPDVTSRLLDHYLQIASIIAGVLEQAQAEGRLHTQIPPIHLAHTFLTALQGVITVSGVKHDFAYRDAITQTLLLLLDV